MTKNQVNELVAFIREHRSNEANFEKLYARLLKEIKNGIPGLEDIKEKSAEEYRSAKQTGGNTWPEFEKFVSEFETIVLKE